MLCKRRLLKNSSSGQKVYKYTYLIEELYRPCNFTYRYTVMAKEGTYIEIIMRPKIPSQVRNDNNVKLQSKEI